MDRSDLENSLETQFAHLINNETIYPNTTIRLEHAVSKKLPPPKARKLELTGPQGLLEIDPRTLPTLEMADIADLTGAEFRVIGELGEGGMGLVQHVSQRSLQRHVAFKRLKHNQHGQDKQIALLREAMFTGYLEHPNIVPVYQLGQDQEGKPAFVMKQVEGASWLDVLYTPHHRLLRKARKTPLEWHIEVLIQVCNAVSFAHAKGILHRDIKPENVMIGEYGEVYLLDWGLGFRMEDSVVGQPLVGTPAYMPPEMVELSHDMLGPHTDVYLLGATLHEIITREPRHRGDKLVAVLMRAAVSEPYDYPEEVPSELGKICNIACHPDPMARYMSVEEFRDALSQFLEHRLSVDLAMTATQCLVEVERMLALDDTERDDQKLYRRFSECHFGFEQALGQWPDNFVAQMGRESAIRTMVDFELGRDNLGAARALVSGLDEIPDDIGKRLDALTEHQTKIEALANDYDSSVSRDARWLVIRALMVIFVLMALFISLSSSMGLYTPTVESEIIPPLFIFFFAASVTFGWRHELLKNRINRQIAAFGLLGNAAVIVNRAASIKLQTELYEVFRVDMLIFALVCALGSVALHRSLVGMTLIWLAMFGASVALPNEWTFSLLPIGSVLLVAYAMAWYLKNRRTPPL